MKWIKASERLPEKTEDTTKNSYAVKCFNRKDAIYWDGYNWFWIGTNEKVTDADFTNIEWLDESNSTVGNEQDAVILVEALNYILANPFDVHLIESKAKEALQKFNSKK